MDTADDEVVATGSDDVDVATGLGDLAAGQHALSVNDGTA